MLVGADLALAALALSEFKPTSGRGASIEVDLPGGPALVIDDSYNANPASVAASLAVLGQAADRPARTAYCRARRHARTWAARASAPSRPASSRCSPMPSISYSAADR
jgi:UDP-N-acetylmuramyl tripeptide synthase